MRWEDLIRYNNLCNASPLVSLVFCCKATKECPFRSEALRILGISEEEYTRVKDENGIKAEGTCYGNLAYCCSLNEECEARDNALKKLGITPQEYLAYKYKILKELIPESKLKLALERRVVHQFAFEVVSLHNAEVGYRGIALGNPEITETLFVLNFQRITPRLDEEVRDSIKKDKFLSVRVSKTTYDRIVDVAALNGCSVSDLVRDAIKVYLSLQTSEAEGRVLGKSI